MDYLSKIFEKETYGYIADKYTDPPRGALTNVEVLDYTIDYSKEDKSKLKFDDPIVNIVLKGFSFYDNFRPSQMELIQRANGNRTIQFHLLGGEARLTKFAYTTQTDRGHGKIQSSDIYFLANELHKQTHVDLIPCFTLALALSSTSFKILPPPMKTTNWGFHKEVDYAKLHLALKIHKIAYVNDQGEKETVQYDYSHYVNNAFMNHFLQVDCRDIEMFNEFYDQIINEQTFNDNWLLNFMYLMLTKNKLVCVSRNAIKNNDIETLKQSIVQYHQTVQKLNQEFIYKYDKTRGYFYYWFFYHKLKNSNDVNTLREWHNFILSDNSLSKSETITAITTNTTNDIIATTNDITNNNTIQLTTTTTTPIISTIHEKDIDSTSPLFFNIKDKFIQTFKRYSYIPLTTLTSYGLGKVINTWFIDKKEKVLKVHPDRISLIETCSIAFRYDPSIKNMKYLWELLSLDKITDEQMSEIITHYEKNNTPYVFLPSQMDWSLGITLYTTLLVELFKFIRYAYYIAKKNIQKVKNDKIDDFDDSTRDFAQLTKQGASALSMLAGYTYTHAGVSGLTALKGYLMSSVKNGSKIVYGIGDVFVGTTINDFKRVLIDYVGSAVLDIVKGSVTTSIQFIPIILGLLNPFFLIPVFAKLFAIIRIDCHKLYNSMIPGSSVYLPDVSKKEIQKGAEIFNVNLKQEFEQQVNKINTKSSSLQLSLESLESSLDSTNIKRQKKIKIIKDKN